MFPSSSAGAEHQHYLFMVVGIMHCAQYRKYDGTGSSRWMKKRGNREKNWNLIHSSSSSSFHPSFLHPRKKKACLCSLLFFLFSSTHFGWVTTWIGKVVEGPPGKIFYYVYTFAIIPKVRVIFGQCSTYVCVCVCVVDCGFFCLLKYLRLGNATGLQSNIACL